MYDGEGRRSYQSPTYSSANVAYYLYDGDTPVLETDDVGNFLAFDLHGASGMESRTTSYDIGYEAYAYDPQGNTVAPVSVSVNGTQATLSVVELSAYDAYGLNVVENTQGAYDPADPVGFGGQYGYYHDYQGRYLLGHRYYDPRAGRFVTRDPIGYKGGINLYGFAGNNPVNEMDPDGTDQVGINPSQHDIQRTAGMDWLDHRRTETYSQAYNKASAAEILAFNKHQRENQRNFDIEVTALSLAYGGGELRGLYAGGRGVLAAIAARQAAKTIGKKVVEDEGETFISFFHKGLLDNPTKPLSTGTSEEDVAAVIEGHAPVHEFRVPSRVFLKWQQEGLATTARTNMNGRTITEWVFRRGAKQQMLNEFRVVK